MATDGSLTRTDRRRPAQEDICPLESKSLRTAGEAAVSKLDRKACVSTGDRWGDERTRVSGDRDMNCDITVTREHVGVYLDKAWLNSPADALTSEASEDELGRLDIDLDRKSKQHNLTSSNVRAILHEVITHEHVVTMMKAAIRDTQDLPMFEPKMTRSRLRQVVQQGQPLTWSLSLSTVKPPQFVDIDLEEDEDSSDEEYCPDEEEEEEEDTAEETFHSDADSLASPPRMHLASQPKLTTDEKAEQRPPGHLEGQVKTSTCAPHHLLPAPESSFLERLNAVEEELDCSPAYTYNQSLDRKADDEGVGRHGDSRCLAYRTRSKLRLVNVPLGQLEAELLAPDITADMYEQSSAQREEDRHWTKWLQGLMAPETEEEGDDDDDPEYNFLDDLDEPDLEDYRIDRAVQITKKEVNELLEELFHTFQEEEVVEEQEEDEEEVAAQGEEVLPQTGPKFNVPQALRFEAPLASILTERRRTVRKQYEAQQQKRALQDATGHHHNNINLKDTPSPQQDTVTPVLVLPSQFYPALHLDHTQKLQLQQQIQQHVQLLTQVHLLCRHVDTLNHETSITKRYLEELQQFARRQEELLLSSSFRVCNLQGALDLLQEVEQRTVPPPAPAPPAAFRRWLPRMSLATSSFAFPLMPAEDAWLFATRSVFMYPELLPVCRLAIHNRRCVYTAGEDGLIVLGLKHFEGTVLSDQLISSYLLCKTRWNLRKRIREMSGPRGPHNNVIKAFLTQGVVPPLPLACSRVQPVDRRPPVDRDTARMPNWLKNSQLIIQKTRLDSTSYPPSLPPGCSLRLHPSWLKKSSHPPPPRPRRIFTLAHNASLLPLAKAPADRQEDGQPCGYLSLPPPGVTLLSDPLAGPGAHGAVPLAAVPSVPVQPVSCLPIGQTIQQSVSRQQNDSPAPSLLLPLPDSTNPIMPCSTDAVKPAYFLIQMVWTPPPITSQHPLGQETHRPIREENTNPRLSLKEERSQVEEGGRRVEEEGGRRVEEEGGRRVEEEEGRWVEEQGGSLVEEQGGSLVEEQGGSPVEEQGGSPVEEQGGSPVEEQVGRQVEEDSSASASTLSPLSSCTGDEVEENWTDVGVVRLNGGENTSGEEQEGRDGGGIGGGGGGGEEETGGGGEEEQEGEDEEEGQREDGGGEREEDGEKDKDEDQDRQGEEEEEEEEEEDFDDLTQDEDEEEVMSSASEESVLSVPELQETMKQLTWLAAERRLCADGDSEEDHSPTSPGSQEEEEEEEEEGPKEEESGEGSGSKVERDEETPSGEGTPRGGGRCPGRGRGRSRPLRGLRKRRQERHSKDATKLLLLYDENILSNDPHRESKDVAFAQSYLNRVREALQDLPGQVEEFVSLLSEFEQVGDGQEVMLLFRKLRCLLGDRTDLLRDFAAFLHPEQALQCGLFEEQQAFERSRRFLRQLEISFGDNPSHYQKIIKALQTGPDLSPTSIHELKAQMATLLKGHTHLQAEFWVFFDELRPPPARPGQFEEAHWLEDGGGGSDGGEGVGLVPGGGASSGFEEVTLPELEEEEEGHKSQPMMSQRRRRKMDGHRNYKDCDWSDKDWPCLCRNATDVKIRRHRRKRCAHCHGSKVSGGVSRAMKSLDPLYSQMGSEPGDKDLDLKEDDSPQPDQSAASWESSFPLTDEKEEEELEDLEEEEEEEEERRTTEKRSRREEVMEGCSASPIPSSTSSSVTSSVISTPSITSSISPSASSSLSFSSSAPPRPSPPSDLPVCAKNISLTASGEKVILWTREADRVILTTCQQEGATQNTFQAISNLLGNKTASEVSRRFRDLMRLFRTAARQTNEDEAPPTETQATNEEDK